MSTKSRVIVVPTSGYSIVNDQTFQVSPQGLKRIEAAELQPGIDPIFFAGGMECGKLPAEATVYCNHHFYLYPNSHRPRYAIGEAYCTARDMWKVAKAIKREYGKVSTVTFSSYPAHRFRCKLSFMVAALLSNWSPSFEDIESGETQLYSSRNEAILILVTLLDPLWVWLGLPLVWKANQRHPD